MSIPKLKETSCTCKECVNMCKKRPCWGFYGGIEQILEETGMEKADEIN